MLHYLKENVLVQNCVQVQYSKTKSCKNKISHFLKLIIILKLHYLKTNVVVQKLCTSKIESEIKYCSQHSKNLRSSVVCLWFTKAETFGLSCIFPKRIMDVISQSSWPVCRFFGSHSWAHGPLSYGRRCELAWDSLLWTRVCKNNPHLYRCSYWSPVPWREQEWQSFSFLSWKIHAFLRSSNQGLKHFERPNFWFITISKCSQKCMK